MILFAFTLSNCSVGIGTAHHNHAPKTKKVPPGQAKKMTGQKSAKNFAPGHNKW